MTRGARNAVASVSLGLVLTHLLCIITVIHGFNLEARIPVIKRGEAGSYFGYSVAEHQQLEGNSSSKAISWFVSHLVKNYEKKKKTGRKQFFFV